MTESNWIKQLDRLHTEIIDIETDDSGDFEAPFDFGRRVQIPYDTAVDEDYSKVFQFLPEKSYKSERATDTKETFCEPVKFCTEKSISDNNTTTQLVNSNELDYILEQIGNLPKTHFEGASDVIYTPITDRKQRDHDLLKELEQFADKNTEHKKSTNKAPRISNIVEAAYIPPKTVYQDLRKLQGIQELSYIHTGSNAVKGTGDILCPQAASRVSKLSIMSQRITFSSSDSESDDDDHWRENIRQQIKKNNSTISVKHSPKFTANGTSTDDLVKTIDGPQKMRIEKSNSKQSPVQTTLSTKSNRNETNSTTPRDIYEVIKRHAPTDNAISANAVHRDSRIIYDINPSAQTNPLSNVDVGSMNLYREYLQMYKSSEGSTAKNAHQQKSASRKNRKEKTQTLPDTIRNVPPLFDPEISRRLNVRTFPSEQLDNILLLSVPMASLGSPFMSNNGKNVPADSTHPRFGLTYSLLLTWLLSLVPKEANKPNGSSMGDGHTPDQLGSVDSDDEETQSYNAVRPPFNVVGLQMVSRNSLLYIDIAVVPHATKEKDQQTTRGKKGKRRISEFDECCSRVRRFLQSNKLADCTHWAWHDQSPIRYLLNETDFTIMDKPLSSIIQLTQDPHAANRVFTIPTDFEWAQIIPQNDQLYGNFAYANNQTVTPENTFGLILGDAFALAFPLLEMFIKISFYCLDISGMKLCWLTKEEYNTVTLSTSFDHAERHELVPCLGMCLRGQSALSHWQSIVGPRNSRVARFTDESSLSAIYGHNLVQMEININAQRVPEICIFYSPRSQERSQELLIQMFGGHIMDADLSRDITVAQIQKQGRCSALTVCRNQLLFFALSPRLPVRFVSDCIITLQNFGFIIEAVRRSSLSVKQVAQMDIDQVMMDTGDTNQPTTMIMVSRENAVQHCAGIMNRLQEEMLAPILTSHSSGELRTLLYSTVLCRPFTQDLGKTILPSLVKNPSFQFDSWMPKPWYFSEVLSLEQTACIVLTGSEAISMAGVTLVELLHGGGVLDTIQSDDYLINGYENSIFGFELVGLRHINQLTEFQARELCPYQIGDDQFNTSVNDIFSSPVMICILRRLNAITLLNQYKQKVKKSRNLDLIVSTSAVWTHRIILTFFEESELHNDESARPHIKYLPKNKKTSNQKVIHQLYSQEISILKAPVLLPPSSSILFYRVLKDFEKLNMKICSIRLFPQLDDAQVEILSTDTELTPQMRILKNNHWQSGYIYMIVVEGIDLIRLLNVWAGHYDPDQARQSQPGSFRAQHGIDVVYNGVFVPFSFEQAERIMTYLCPAGPDEHKIDYDVSLNSASLSQISVPKADSEENALIVIRPSNAPSIFEKLYRSNFSIIGLRTVRLSRKSAKTIFNVSKDVEKVLTTDAVVCCVVQRRTCLDVLRSLNLDVITCSSTRDEADEQIPKVFSELLVL